MKVKLHEDHSSIISVLAEELNATKEEICYCFIEIGMSNIIMCRKGKSLEMGRITREQIEDNEILAKMADLLVKGYDAGAIENNDD